MATPPPRSCGTGTRPPRGSGNTPGRPAGRQQSPLRAAERGGSAYPLVRRGSPHRAAWRESAIAPQRARIPSGAPFIRAQLVLLIVHSANVCAHYQQEKKNATIVLGTWVADSRLSYHFEHKLWDGYQKCVLDLWF